MAESNPFLDLVQQGIDGFLSDREEQLARIAPELTAFTGHAHELLSGGKRFRAQFCYWGWKAFSGAPDSIDPMPVPDSAEELRPVALAATALEVFHAAALVHDDLIDNSDTRRGAPSAHRQLESVHLQSGWLGDGARFGRSAAVLLGDLLLGWSDELLDRGIGLLADRRAGQSARSEFNRMRTEVTAGQYLDVLEEHAWNTVADRDALSRAHRVIVYKSAKYSIESPLAIGAGLAGASVEQIASLRAFGLPLGVAFQLRDDLLGVFGDPERTGKPAGDDLREGKRTVLVALARIALPASSRRLIDELLGDPGLDDEQVAMIRTALVESGALAKVEQSIEHNLAAARDALQQASITPAARATLWRLAEAAARRSA